MDTPNAPAPPPKAPPKVPPLPARNEEAARKLRDQLAAATGELASLDSHIEALERELTDCRLRKSALERQIGRFSGRLDARRLAP